MVEIRRGFPGESGSERLPWLEPVEDEEDYEEEPRGNGRLALIGLGVLAAIGLLIVAIVLFNRWTASRADIGEVIRAPTAPYKEKPANPGGLKVDASGIIAEKTGTGADIDAPLDLTALPEQPIAVPRRTPSAPAAPASAPAGANPAAPSIPPASKPVAPSTAAKPPVAVTPKPTPAPAVTPPAAPVIEPEAIPAPAEGGQGGSTIQLGAFSSEAKAKSVWKAMSSRFSYLASMTPIILPVKSEDKTLYRLRATGAPAAATCAKLRVAGETCAVAN